MSLGHRTSSRCLFVATALALLTACGGKSGSDVDSSDDGSSDGGTGSGGSGDAGSGPTGGGSGGTSTSAGGSGGDGVGGSNADGASNAGGAATGGASNAGGAATGGTSSTGGSGVGGEATSSTSSTGGSGGTNPVPPPELVEGCAATCDAEVAADCASGPTRTSCADGCNLLTRVPACAEQLGSFFDCVAEDDTTSCSNEDEVVFNACVSEQLAAYACVLQEAPDPDLEAPCESYCAGSVDAMCENDDGDLAGCVLWCQSIGTTFPSCQTRWQTLLECSETDGFECDANGEASPVGCGAEGVSFLACICDGDPAVCD